MLTVVNPAASGRHHSVHRKAPVIIMIVSSAILVLSLLVNWRIVSRALSRLSGFPDEECEISAGAVHGGSNRS